MVSEVHNKPVPKEGPILAPPKGWFEGVTVTRTEPYLFRICCEAFGLPVSEENAWVFVVDESGLSLLIRGSTAGTLPWHSPPKG